MGRFVDLARQALHPEHLTAIEKQELYIARMYGKRAACLACAGTHTIWECAPTSFDEADSLPGVDRDDSELVCPTKKKRVYQVLTLFCEQFLYPLQDDAPSEERRPADAG